MRAILLTLTVITYLFASPAIAEKDGHGHDHAKEEKNNEAGHAADELEHSDQGDREEEEGHGEHGHGAHEEGEHEENAQVGPGKGIVEASEADGIKLSPEAEKNFGITKIKFSQNTFKLPRSAVVTAVKEVNIFRYRSGFYKRIDFEQISRTTENVVVKSKDLKIGDEVVVQGLGFLRIAEIAAFGGAPEGHSH